MPTPYEELKSMANEVPGPSIRSKLVCCDLCFAPSTIKKIYVFDVPNKTKAYCMPCGIKMFSRNGIMPQTIGFYYDIPVRRKSKIQQDAKACMKLPTIRQKNFRPWQPKIK